uniref:ATP-binding protein n=1 Tax=Streptomyces sp. NBC_01401 TaxID=2903854 RepID=A0AAU3GR34_9ACTN
MADHTPDYPPRTPPPPKRPQSPPRPDTAALDATTGPGGTPVRSGRRGVMMANRRGTNWVLESAPWAAGKARSGVLGKLGTWGYRLSPEAAGTVGQVVTLLVEAATADSGARVTVHLSDQDRQVCVLVLSHQAGLAPGHSAGGDDVLHQLTAHRSVTGCGTDTGPDGRRTWAVIGL